MAGDEGRRGDDPFEDLDQFFAPLENEEWEDRPPAPASAPPPEPAAGSYPTPAQAAAAPPSDPPDADLPEPPPPPADPADALAGLDLNIELPEEEDLLGAATLPPERAAPEAEDDLTEAPDPEPPADEPEPDLGTAEMAGEEWDRLRAEALAGTAETEDAAEPDPSAEDLDAEDLSVAPPEYEDLPEEDAEAPTASDLFEGPDEVRSTSLGEAPDDIEAAAEHFATGVRDTPEDVERELLSDLGEPTTGETVRIEPPSPVVTEEAPTWQEAAEPVEAAGAAEDVAPPPEGPEGRNLTAALVSGLLLGAAVLALLAIGKAPFVGLALVAILLAQAELYAVMRSRGLQPATLLGLVCGGITVVGAYLHGEPALLLGPTLAIGLGVLWYVAAPPSARKHTTANVAATILGVVYVPFLASFAMLLLRAPGDVGRNAFLIVLALTILYDVCAYAVGTLWGNRQLAPTISPHKSWEGAIGATFILLLVSLSIVPTIAPLEDQPGPAVGLALLLAIVAPLGDLVESALKRDLGVKDMGSILPGHGGMLDRLDAVLFAVPAAYFFFRIALDFAP